MQKKLPTKSLPDESQYFTKDKESKEEKLSFEVCGKSPANPAGNKPKIVMENLLGMFQMFETKRVMNAVKNTYSSANVRVIYNNMLPVMKRLGAKMEMFNLAEFKLDN